MKPMRHLIFCASFALLVFALPATARAQNNVPFGVGEKLTYEAKASRLKLAMSVADLSFEILPGQSPDQVLVKSRAESKGSLLKLFRFSFLQEWESAVDFRHSRIYKTAKHDVQRKRVRDSVAVFDYDDKKVTFTETDPSDPRRPPRRVGSDIGTEMYDLITGLYSLRMRSMKAGETLEIPVSDSGLVYKVPVRVIGREQLKTILGRVWCWHVEPLVFGPGRMIEQDGKMQIWISDDPRRVPVKAELETSYGDIDVTLKSAAFGRSAVVTKPK